MQAGGLHVDEKLDENVKVVEKHKQEENTKPGKAGHQNSILKCEPEGDEENEEPDAADAAAERRKELLELNERKRRERKARKAQAEADVIPDIPQQEVIVTLQEGQRGGATIRLS